MHPGHFRSWKHRKKNEKEGNSKHNEQWNRLKKVRMVIQNYTKIIREYTGTSLFVRFVHVEQCRFVSLTTESFHCEY